MLNDNNNNNNNIDNDNDNNNNKYPMITPLKGLFSINLQTSTELTVERLI